MCVGASVHTLPPELCRYVCILTHLYRVCRNKNKGTVNHSALRSLTLGCRDRRGQMQAIMLKKSMISVAVPLFLTNADMHNSQANLAFLT